MASFWAGTSPSYICNRDYNGLGAETYEWVVSDPDPNGRVRELGPSVGDEAFYAVFTDEGHANPTPLMVEQTSQAFAEAPHSNYVIVRIPGDQSRCAGRSRPFIPGCTAISTSGRIRRRTWEGPIPTGG